MNVQVEAPETAAAALADLRQVKRIATEGAFVIVQGAARQQIIAHLAAKGVCPAGGDHFPPGDLESLFLEMTAEAA